MLIKDVLTIDLSEDIKNVIDLEDMSEAETKAEIENYIITEGLAKEYADFVSVFTSNIVETGVWISGFYGSGKSYFGKLLGYLLSNQMICGTPARDRIIQRFTGMKDEALRKNTMSRLDAENCRVVFLDVAKQDTTKGLSYTLFRNFLKSLGLPENEHGFLLYQLLIGDKTVDVNAFIDKNTDKKWSDVKTRLVEYAKIVKTIYLQKGSNESDYNNLLTTIRRDIDQFGATRLKEEIENYTSIANNEKVVFLFDEASEAINQKKFNLLDLEGISESLSALGGKVWTMAIAQERLDDIINNSNVSRAQLTKVTDRFKTKIHLEATEVDVIIRSRLLNKTDDAFKKLKDHYQQNSGVIGEHSALTATGLAKTDTADIYATYYPFYKYQFDLLQNFLFGTKGYASSKVAARGMIITTYDILKHELQNGSFLDMATGWQIAKEAQPQPNARLVNRFDNAERILKEERSKISGRQLLEAINFLVEAETVPATVTNIVKTFIKKMDDYKDYEIFIKAALNNLVDAKVLLFSNNSYRITSDIEQRLLDEMNGYLIQPYLKKSRVVKAYKSSQYVKTINRISDNGLQYDFYITTDNDDELTNPGQKQLKLKLKNYFNISDDRATDIKALQNQHQKDCDLIYIVPDNSSFKEFDKLVEEIEQTSFLEEKYGKTQSEEAQILRVFSAAKAEKEERFKILIEESLQNATAIYHYSLFQLDKTNWQSTLAAQQRDVIQNVYTKRLTAQLADTVAASVIKEAKTDRLMQYFNSKDFDFFDTKGNFIGDRLKVTEEIVFKIRNNYVDGSTLEKELEQPPTGFAFGTVISSVAALMRAGKICLKFNGSNPIFSWKEAVVKDIFSNARDFRKAAFKAIGKALTAQQKDDIVKALQGMNCEDHTNKKVDWNTNDFEMVSSICELAKRFCNKVDDMRKQNKDFDKLFNNIDLSKEFLSNFTGAVSEANYISKAEEFIREKDSYEAALQAIEKVEKFIRNNLPKLLEWINFIEDVNDELLKAAQPCHSIEELSKHFKENQKEVVKNFKVIQDVAQKIKDEYFKLMESATVLMAEKYLALKSDTDSLISEIATLPDGLNDAALGKIKNIANYAEQRTKTEVKIDFDIKDKNSRFTYSEILSFIDLYNSKKADLEIIKSGLIRIAPEVKPIPEPGKKSVPVINTFTTKMPSARIKVVEYKKWLSHEMQKIAGASDNDEVEIQNN